MRKTAVLTILAVTLASIAPIASIVQPVYAQTPTTTPPVWTYATPELGPEEKTFSGSITNPPNTYYQFTSQELCGEPNVLMGAVYRVTSSSNAGIYLWREIDGSYVQHWSGTPVTSIYSIAYDWGYNYNNPPLSFEGTDVFGVGSTPITDSGTQTTPEYWTSAGHTRYSNGVQISIGKWGGGTTNITYRVRGICSNTGEPPEPQKQHCNPVGKIESYEAIESTITRGALESVDLTEELHEIDVSLNVVLPSAPVRGAANLSYTIYDQGLGMQVDSEELKINGVTFARSQGHPIGIPGQYPEINFNMIPVNLPGQSFAVDIKVTLLGRNIDDAIPYLGSLSISYQAAMADGESLICDTSMELYWDQAQHEPIPIDGSLSPWRELNDGDNNGRFTPSWINALLQGGPTSAACNKKVHAVKTGTVNYSPIYQWFGWWGYGSTLYYKFRYQTGTGPLGIGNSNSSPNVYIVDVDGNIVTDVYGYNQYTPALLSRSQWTYVSGSITLDPGLDYALVLDGIPADPTDQYNKVFYDDVVIGTTSWAGMDDICSNFMMGEVEIDPTPTPTIAPTSSPTPTITPTGTIVTPTPTTPPPGGTATNVPTITITRTQLPSVTPRATSSPWPSSTAIPSLTPHTPAATRTPYYSTATVGPTSTIVPSSIPTATPENYMPPPPDSNPPLYVPPIGTPAPESTPEEWTENPGVFVPGGPGGPGSPGEGSWFIACDRPTNPLSLAWWLDYERCMIMSFVSWGPSQQATAQSIPAMFSTYEPFGTMAEVKDGMVVLRTQVAGISGEIGYSGANDPIDPNHVLTEGSSDPWADGASLNLGSQASGITTGAYTNYCSHRLSSQLSGNLAKGACFALNVLKNVGVFPWVQFGINIASVISIVVAALRIVGLAGSVAVYQAQTAADKIEEEE